ncbi:hypothetical protein T4D_13879 [Trichinella pseudospiralis]|uniref:Uncharacterized protein n=1 Tax=Trichinella pseudospiralis TaxID=6337 RepID=A0A0V1FTY8_TRIPS|nr:hypothetical protein T4D_13879 [Trichinella pseudospiralis]
MLHGVLSFIHLATANTIVGDNSRALLSLVSGFVQLLAPWHLLFPEQSNYFSYSGEWICPGTIH